MSSDESRLIEVTREIVLEGFKPRCRVPVNLTLGFSARQNVLTSVFARPTYCNVFLGRLNSVVADHGLGDGRNRARRADEPARAPELRGRPEGDGRPHP